MIKALMEEILKLEKELNQTKKRFASVPCELQKVASELLRE